MSFVGDYSLHGLGGGKDTGKWLAVILPLIALLLAIWSTTGQALTYQALKELYPEAYEELVHQITVDGILVKVRAFSR